MLTSEGFVSAIKNVYILSARFAGSEPVENIDQLRTCYHAFLRDLYPEVPVNESRNFFVDDEKIEDRLAAAFHMKEALGQQQQRDGFIGPSYPLDKKLERIERVRVAMDELLSLDEDLRSLFELVVHTVLIREPKPLANGGYSHSCSAATAVGVIWLSAVDFVTKEDFKELLIHELIHQLLFIDDFVTSQFQYVEMSKPESFALSAISLTPRPMDVVIHSIIVACELLVSRQRLIGEPLKPTVHPPSAAIKATLAQSFESLVKAPTYSSLVTPRIQGFLDHCKRQLKELDSNELSISRAKHLVKA